MTTYTTDTIVFRAVDRRLHQAGTLTLSTRIDIRGNYLKGLVRVTLRFQYRFTPGDEFQEFDEEDQEYNRVSYSGDFLSEDERTFFIENSFQKVCVDRF